MNVILAATVGALFGSGAYLMLKADLFRVVVGMLLISNAANVTLMASGLSRGVPPILPFGGEEGAADPLVQALTLTAIVIGFAVSALLLALVLAVYRTSRSVDLDELSRTEARLESELEREEVDA